MTKKRWCILTYWCLGILAWSGSGLDADEFCDAGQVMPTGDLPSVLVKVSPSVFTSTEGGTVTFTIGVCNTDTMPFTLTDLSDDIHGNLDGVGACDMPVRIAKGGLFECYFAANVAGMAGSTETTTVTVEVLDDEGSTNMAQASATIEIIAPAN